MYFPYLRGKQFELQALKESVTNLKADKVFPVIEPVKLSINQLSLAISELNQHSIIPYIVINPEHGDYSNLPSAQLINTLIGTNTKYTPCIRITKSNEATAIQLIDEYRLEGLEYALYLQEDVSQVANINIYLQQAKVNLFRDPSFYSPVFISSAPRSVILRDSFPAQKRNADYPITPVFYSDAHLSYNNGEFPLQIGFGDFLIMPEKWTEGGGPAFVVAIHLTYIENEMYVRHFLSVKNSTDQNDPGNKFLEALDELIAFANQNSSVNKNTIGYLAFLDLYTRGHYPGLGISKKFSMMHHIETISEFL